MKIRGERHYLWRAVDQEDGDVIDILVQRYRNARAAKRFFRKLLKGAGEHGVATGDGQVEKLRRRPPEHYAFRGSQQGTLREQSG